MRIAFYAPLKPPTHPNPSGDRQMARMLVQALRHAGHEVHLASRFRSREAAGNEARLQRLQRVGEKLAERLIRRSEEHTSELQSLMRISYAVFCLKKKKKNDNKDQLNETQSNKK